MMELMCKIRRAIGKTKDIAADIKIKMAASGEKNLKVLKNKNKIK